MVKKLFTLAFMVACLAFIGLIVINAPIEKVEANASLSNIEDVVKHDDENKISLDNVELGDDTFQKRNVVYTNNNKYEMTLNKDNVSVIVEDNELKIEIYFEKDGVKSSSVDLKPNEKVNIELYFRYEGQTEVSKEISYQIKIDMMKKI